MPKIDEPPISGNHFYELDWILAKKNEIDSLISTIYLSKSAKKSDIKKKLNEVYLFLKDNALFCDIAINALGRGSKYDEWVNQLTPKNQDIFRVRLIDKTSDSNHYLKVGSYAAIPIKRLGYHLASKEYFKETKSHWLEVQDQNNTLIERQVAQSVETFVQEELSSASASYSMQHLLSDLVHDFRISTHDKEIIQAHIHLLTLQKIAYNQLNLHSLFSPSNQSITTMIEKLCDKYKSSAYGVYQQSLDNLLPSTMKVLVIIKQYPHLESRINKLIAYAQASSTRTKNQHRSLQELNHLHGGKNDHIESMVITAAIRLTTQMALAKVDGLLSKYSLTSMQRKREAQKYISYYDTLVLPEKLPEIGLSKEQDIYRSAYLAKLLVEGFPHIFYQPQEDVFEIRGRGKLQLREYVCDALSLSKSAVEKAGLLNPKMFDVTLLKNLYSNLEFSQVGNDHNPVWLLLTMIKPVDNQFTLIQKIEAYKEVIQLLKKGQCQFGNISSVSIVHHLILNLKDYILTTHVKNPKLITNEVIDALKTLEPYLSATSLSIFHNGEALRQYKEMQSILILALEKPMPPAKPPRQQKKTDEDQTVETTRLGDKGIS